MTKADLVGRISAVYPYMSLKNIDRVLSIIFGSIINKLAEGGRVELRDFGSFSVRQRDSIVGRNPKSGEKVIVAARKVPFFKAGKNLKDVVNGKVKSRHNGILFGNLKGK
ncbi:MAG: integration host factor subunit beta [Alphaproteobacteria bacterium]|nr:integration host factor subunit beta [Alphaproteobacteria bacterium]